MPFRHYSFINDNWNRNHNQCPRASRGLQRHHVAQRERKPTRANVKSATNWYDCQRTEKFRPRNQTSPIYGFGAVHQTLAVFKKPPSPRERVAFFVRESYSRERYKRRFLYDRWWRAYTLHSDTHRFYCGSRYWHQIRFLYWRGSVLCNGNLGMCVVSY